MFSLLRYFIQTLICCIICLSCVAAADLKTKLAEEFGRSIPIPKFKRHISASALLPEGSIAPSFHFDLSTDAAAFSG